MASLLGFFGVLNFAVCYINIDHHLQEQSSHQLLNLGPGLIDTFSVVTKELKAMSQFLKNIGSRVYDFVFSHQIDWERNLQDL